jgi:hypothetical protein
MSHIALTHIDISNALEALKALEEPTESEIMTIKKLEMMGQTLYDLQKQMKEAQNENSN